MNFNSKPVILQAERETVYNFLSDFNNFGNLMPDQVKNWEAEKEKCSFTIQGMTDLSLKFTEKDPPSSLKIEPEGKTPIQFDLLVTLEADIDNNQLTSCVFEINANLNPMMAMIAKRPLENMVDIMAVKLNEIFS